MTQQHEGQPGQVVTVRLDVLQSVLDSAITSAVRHAASGTTNQAREVLYGRQGEIVGLAVARVLQSLAASGYIGRPGGVVPGPIAQPEVL